jgi:hypothetical protein
MMAGKLSLDYSFPDAIVNPAYSPTYLQAIISLGIYI